jgi:hypothetical protein
MASAVLVVAMLHPQQRLRLEQLHRRASWGLLNIFVLGLGKGAASPVPLARLHRGKQLTV